MAVAEISRQLSLSFQSQLNPAIDHAFRFLSQLEAIILNSFL
jgi:hypothetical protein